MSDATPPFAFSQFVPGFDFLKNLADAAATTAKTSAAGGGAGPLQGMPGLSSWVAPTISVEEVDKRIQELKTVQYWLEQNGHALKATIQALEVQKMTLSTLRGMNVRMEDLASAFTRHATSPASAAPAPASPPAAPAAPAPSFSFSTPPAEPARSEAASDAAGEADNADEGAAGASAGVVDPMQWWNALSSQFQEIATSAIHEAAQMKMPAMPTVPQASAPAAPRKKAPTKASGGKTSATRKTSATGKPPAARKRSRGA